MSFITGTVVLESISLDHDSLYAHTLLDAKVISEDEMSWLGREAGNLMVKRVYKIRVIPADKIGKDEFEAPPGWDLFCLWSHEGQVFGVFERLEEVT